MPSLVHLVRCTKFPHYLLALLMTESLRDSSVEQLHVACYMRDSVIGLIIRRRWIDSSC